MFIHKSLETASQRQYEADGLSGIGPAIPSTRPRRQITGAITFDAMLDSDYMRHYSQFNTVFLNTSARDTKCIPSMLRHWSRTFSNVLLEENHIRIWPSWEGRHLPASAPTEQLVTFLMVTTAESTLHSGAERTTPENLYYRLYNQIWDR